MKKRLYIFLLPILLLSGCLFQETSPDPELPINTSQRSEEMAPKLYLAEYAERLDLGGTHRSQEYQYDDRGRLISIYAPEDYLACISEIPYIWIFYEQSKAVEERYSYDEDHLTRITGFGPGETSNNAIVYEIAITYDETGKEVQEILSRAGEIFTANIKYYDGQIKKVETADGRTAEFFYEDGNLSGIAVTTVEGDYEYTYSQETGAVLISTDGSVFSETGEITKIRCTGPRSYTERRDYTSDGNLIYRVRDYDDDPQNSYIWNYYYHS